MKPKKVLATLEFGREEITDYLRDEIAQMGFVVEDEIEWRDDGSVKASVRPMTPEEKEENDLQTEDPVKTLTKELEALLNEGFSNTRRATEVIYDEVSRLREIIQSSSAVETRESAPAKKKDYSGVTVVSAENYGLEPAQNEEDEPTQTDQPEYLDENGEPLSEEKIRSRKRIERLRKEQGMQPEIYPSSVKDDDGFVRLKQPNNSTE